MLTTATIRALREQIQPTPEIHFLTKKAYAEVLAHNPNIDHIHTIEQSTAEVAPALLELEFDYIIDLHRNLRSARVKKRLKMIDFTVDKQNFDKWLLVNFGSKRDKIRHIADRYRDCLRSFGVSDDMNGLDFFIAPEAADELLHVAPSLPETFTAIALGATHLGKRMSTDLLTKVIEGTHANYVLLGSAADTEAAAALIHLPGVTDLSGKLSLHGSAEAICRSAQLLTGDTGLMHIGAALGKRIVSVWGCTDPCLGMAPYRADADSVIITPYGRDKRPCSKLGDRCKYGKNNLCIDAVDPHEVISALKPA